MATKYAEGLLAVKYREVTADGRVLGGPFHYIEKGLGRKWKPLAVVFAVFGIGVGLFGIGTFSQVHGISSAVQSFSRSLGFGTGLYKTPPYYAVKVPVFSFEKLSDADSFLGPEMKSTGEAIGYDDKLYRAFYKALQASGLKVQNYGTVFVTVANNDKEEVLPLIRRFYNLGFNIQATKGTADFLKSNGIKTHVLKKISEGSDEIPNAIRQGHLAYIINTSDIGGNESASFDGHEIRKLATENNVNIFTSLDTVKTLLDVLEETTICISTIDA
jgi:hypothetical protein